MDKLQQIRKLLGIVYLRAPKYQGKDIIHLRCYIDFEGHGKASEDFEEHWTLEFPQLPYAFKNANKEWIFGAGKTCFGVHGKTYDEVLDKAIEYLEAKKKNEEDEKEK